LLSADPDHPHLRRSASLNRENSVKGFHPLPHDGHGLDKPVRQCKRCYADNGACRRRPGHEEGCSRFADDDSVFRLVVHDVGRDLHDVGVARTGGCEDQTDVAHGLCCLRGKVSGADQRAVLIDGHLPRCIGRACS
jgi:hypothetical protein